MIRDFRAKIYYKMIYVIGIDLVHKVEDVIPNYTPSIFSDKENPRNILGDLDD